MTQKFGSWTEVASLGRWFHPWHNIMVHSLLSHHIQWPLYLYAYIKLTLFVQVPLSQLTEFFFFFFYDFNFQHLKVSPEVAHFATPERIMGKCISQSEAVMWIMFLLCSSALSDFLICFLRKKVALVFLRNIGFSSL